MRYKWTIDEKSIPFVSNLKELGLKGGIRRALINRGVLSPLDYEAYFDTDLEFHNPLNLKHMDISISRINNAILSGEHIYLYGDYDVDGVTSIVILYKTIKALGGKVDYVIPSRFEHGYGLNRSCLDSVKSWGGSLIITVDCGISAFSEIEYTKSLGMDIIVTDHHSVQGTLPNAYSVINPKREDEEYPYRELCGAGVALKLSQALLGYVDDECLAFAAIGTVADIVPLTGENRLIVSKGLEKLSKTNNLGIKSLFEVMGRDRDNISTGLIGFGLGPRINACGRLSEAHKAVDLFLTEDPKVALELSNYLESENKKRQEIQRTIFEECDSIVELANLTEHKALLVRGEDWHQGVIGIVASKLTEKYNRPSIVFTSDEDKTGIKASARSIKEFDIFDGLSRFKEYFTAFGGHKMAAGLTVATEFYDIFEDAFYRFVDETISEEDLVPKLKVDGFLDVGELDEQDALLIEKMEPFGMGNKKPLFIGKGCLIMALEQVGRDKAHLKITIKHKEKIVEGIIYGVDGLDETLKLSSVVDVAFTPELNNWRGNKTLKLIIQDISVDEVATSLRASLSDKTDLRVDSLVNTLGLFNVVEDKRIIDKDELISYIELHGNTIIVCDSIHSLREIESFVEMMGFVGKKKLAIVTKESFDVSSDYDLILLNGLFFGDELCDGLSATKKSVFVLKGFSYQRVFDEFFDLISISREDAKEVYMHLKSLKSMGIEVLESSRRVFTDNRYGQLKLDLIMLMFSEAQLIRFDKTKFEIASSNKKINLEETRIYDVLDRAKTLARLLG